MRFIEMMNQEKLTLVFSSPLNDYKMLRAAWENGAEAVKVHLNVNHHASHTQFKTFAEEKDVLAKILADSPVPVGLVMGGSSADVVRDLDDILAENFDFCSLYLHHTPLEVYQQKKLTKMSACDYTYSLDDIHALGKNGAEIIETSIVHPDEYGDLLTMKEIITYQQIREQVTIPMLVPSQKKVRVSDLSQLTEVGVNGLMIGAVVTGKTVETVSRSLASFRNGIDRL